MSFNEMNRKQTVFLQGISLRLFPVFLILSVLVPLGPVVNQHTSYNLYFNRVMETIQINAQKIWGPPKDWLGPPPPHGTEVFVKNIPDNVFEDELYYLFSSVGRIYEVRLPVHWTGINKGYAFVRYANVTEADSAIQKLNHWSIRPNRQIKVERSLDNMRLFLSSVPNDKTGEELKSDLLTVVENVKNVYVYPAVENPALYRGYAFVEFMSHRDAAIAKRILTPDVLFNLFERKCIAAWANPLPYISKETLKNINILFLRNIPNDTKSTSIRIAVDSLISPDSVYRVKRLNDFAFLTFKNHDIAERAMHKIIENPFLLGMKAVLVEWAIPREISTSLSTKFSDPGKEEDVENNFHPKLENCQNQVLKMFEDYKKNHSEFINENKINRYCLKVCNIEKNPFSNTNVNLLQKRTPKFESFSTLNKTNAKPSFQTHLRQNNVNKQGQLSALIPDQNYHLQEQSIITDFCHPNIENYYRNMHLTNWLESSALRSQTKSCSSSPTLTSPSTGSSPNMSWKWEEGCSPVSFGSWNSMDFDVQGLKINDNAKNCERFAWL